MMPRSAHGEVITGSREAQLRHCPEAFRKEIRARCARRADADRLIRAIRCSDPRPAVYSAHVRPRPRAQMHADRSGGSRTAAAELAELAEGADDADDSSPQRAGIFLGTTSGSLCVQGNSQENPGSL